MIEPVQAELQAYTTVAAPWIDPARSSARGRKASTGAPRGGPCTHPSDRVRPNVSVDSSGRSDREQPREGTE